MEGVVVLLVVFGALGAMLYGAYRWIRGVINRGHELKALVNQGVMVTGYISKLERVIRSRAGTDQLYLTYRFQDSSGQEHTKRLRVFSKEYDRMSQGDPVEIMYLRDRPKVNATCEIVEEMRGGMARHGVS